MRIIAGKSMIAAGAIFLGVSATALTLNATTAQAATYNLTFNQVHGNNPSGLPTATLADVVGGVQLSINLAGLSGGEFVSSVFFNFTGSEAALDNLTFTRTGGNGPTNFTELSNLNSQADNNGGANQVGRYDIGLVFENNNNDPAQRFDADETLTFLISSVPGVAASAFLANSAQQDSSAIYLAYARIQGIANGGSARVGANTSVEVNPLLSPVPIPAVGASLPALLALGGFVWARRRKAAAANA
jgi:hypothetical protein